MSQIDSLKTIIFSTTDVDLRYSAYNKLISQIPWETPDSTLKYCTLFQELPGVKDNKSYLANIEYYKGRANRSKGDYTIALEHFATSKSIYESLRDSSNIAKASYQLGIINLFKGNMELSLQFLTSSLNLYKKVGTENDLADLNNALASYYSDNDQIDVAIEKYNKALEIYETLNDSMGIANVHANLGMAYVELENYKLAEKHLLIQGRIDTLLKTNWGLGFHNDYMGYLFESKGELENALVWYNRALDIRKGEKSHYNLCESLLSLGSVYYEMRNYDKAIPYLKEVLLYEDAHQSLSQLERAYRTLSDCHEALGNSSNALLYFKKFKSTADSIYQRDKIKELTTLESEIKKAELDAEIEVLSAEKEYAELSLSQQKKFTLVALLSSLLFMTLGTGVFFLYRNNRSQKLQIESSLKEKDLLLREIHHRVKNNLQIISSVLSLQSRQIKDSGIQQAINEGRNRVRSMALIHQNLYQKENLTGITVILYLEKLVEELFHTYNISKDFVTLNLDVEQMDLDVDTMIPLGLIINELVSNSLKHAFTDMENGKIKISLKEVDKKLILNVEDNGKGVTESELIKSNSFGNRLIRAFSQKLKAELKVESKNGTKITMIISRYLKAA